MAYETLTFRPSKENKTLLAQLAKLAKQDNRNLNNYIENNNTRTCLTQTKIQINQFINKN